MGLMRWKRSEFIASMSEGCMVEARSGESFRVATCSTGNMTTASATGRLRLTNALKMVSIFSSQAGIPPDVAA
jgi:hypothetical protein